MSLYTYVISADDLCGFVCAVLMFFYFYCFGPWGVLRTAVPCHDTVVLTLKLSHSLCKLLSPWLPFTVTFSASDFGIYILTYRLTEQFKSCSNATLQHCLEEVRIFFQILQSKFNQHCVALHLFTFDEWYILYNVNTFH